MKKKTIIIIYGRANEGKTSTLLILYRLLTNILVTNDISITIQFENLNIGFVTSSDPYENNLEEFEQNLINRKNENCDYIFCTSRTRGKSISIIDRNFADYHKIWLSSVWTPTLNSDLINNNHAIYLEHLLHQLIANQNFYNS